MKPEPHVKRRVTLSRCGLGMLGEREPDAMPQAPAPGGRQPRSMGTRPLWRLGPHRQGIPRRSQPMRESTRPKSAAMSRKRPLAGGCGISGAHGEVRISQTCLRDSMTLPQFEGTLASAESRLKPQGETDAPDGLKLLHLGVHPE